MLLGSQSSRKSLGTNLRFTLVLILTLPLASNVIADVDLDESSTPTESSTESEGMELFHGSFEDALALAGEQDKLVFVDVYTMWCGPCIVMQETVFPEAEVGEYFNPRFVNIKLDMEDEDQNGPEIGAKYDVGVVPTYLILDRDGNELGRATGGATPSQFISMISRALGETTSTFDALQARYEEGERSQEFIQQYLMDAIVELAFRDIDNQDIESIQAYFDESEKYKMIADEYFSSRPYAELINETDAHLVLNYHERSSRGEELVEFVIEHYDEFLAVSSESAMAQFSLNATLGAVADTARAGDEKFTDYIDALETEPLKRAVEYERNRYPESSLLPERLKYAWEADYLIAKEDWDGVAELYRGRFEKSGDRATAGNYRWAAQRLLQSDNPTHHETALGYARRAYEMNKRDGWGASLYVSALAKNAKLEEARELAVEYRSGLTDSTVDQQELESFEFYTDSILQEDSAESEESQE